MLSDRATERIKTGLMPVGRGDTRLFILGSLPGDASLAEQRYYAHPTNQFWRLVGHAIHEDLQNLPYDQRLNRLAERRIGLWDVIASATRRGSLDQAIRLADHNPVGKLLTDFPDMTALAFNGLAAASAGRRLVGSSHQLSLIDLPSSSAANTRPFAEKARAWAVLAQFVA